ncbi:hypothetical protein WR25_03316 isoform D [Diploscapter pachys]|uniref:Uncharacterized protein n=1 Tax=Diploscapter pachys TaxID=2018661 RepID=A0A2A2L3K4_9BILA|nr:hypothetical protein WR25_03316 isoform D [Diploscapter pachys]
MSGNSEESVIGIDLGTTRCCVAIVDGTGKAQTIPNDLGRNTTPSFVLYDQNGDAIHVGDAAINTSNTGRNLIYDAKRLIGRQFNDQVVMEDRRKWSFEVVRETDVPNTGKAMIKIGDNYIAPEDVSAELLKKMKEYAKSYMKGRDVKKAVITVPAYFEARQKDATVQAAEKAGLEVLMLITEPTAAAIALAVKQNEKDERIIMIYDLGGGTFDVSIAKIKNGHVDILAISGNNHLGGEDFDETIVTAYIEDFEDKTKLTFPDDKILRRKLRNECCIAKQTVVSMKGSVNIEMTVQVKGQSVNHSFAFNCKQLHQLCEALLQGTMGSVDHALEKAELTPDKVDQILIVGGSTRIPRIKELIKSKFKKAALLQNVNPDEAIAMGAAIYGAQLGRGNQGPATMPQSCRNDIGGNNSPNYYDAAFMTLQICEAVPLSIGMEVRGNLVQIVIPRNTPYPFRKEIRTSTVYDDQKYFTARIYEGERARTSDSQEIGKIHMTNLKTPMSRGNPHITIFEVNRIGILKVTHIEECTGNKVEHMVTYDGHKKNMADIAHFLSEARQHEKEDNEFREVCEERRYFENELYSEKNTVKAMVGGNIRSYFCARIYSYSRHQRTRNWL